MSIFASTVSGMVTIAKSAFTVLVFPVLKSRIATLTLSRALADAGDFGLAQDGALDRALKAHRNLIHPADGLKHRRLHLDVFFEQRHWQPFVFEQCLQRRGREVFADLIVGAGENLVAGALRALKTSCRRQGRRRP
ncbi:MAG: hypothetical protein WDN76_10575 [Alphaproteobacteria bacterium]